MKKAEKKPSQTAETRHTKTLVVNAVRLNIRKKPDMDSDAVGHLVFGEEVEVLGEAKNGWYKTKDGNYVMAEFVS